MGRPNVGKSTLLNRLVGQKLSITSRKPQTTRQNLTGIVTVDGAQLLFVDTPGFQTRYAGTLNRGMNRAVARALNEVDLVLFVVEALKFGKEDEAVQRMLPPDLPILLVINKTDRLDRQELLLPFMQDMVARHAYVEIVPVSGAKGHGIEALVRAASGHLPEGAAVYGADEITEANERTLAAELVREKLFRQLGDELPYLSAVVVDKFELEGGMRRIYASIMVAKDAHKGIVIGAGGARLKEIGTHARKDMERLFGGKVHLELWVKVQPGWSENRQLLKQMGYG